MTAVETPTIPRPPDDDLRLGWEKHVTPWRLNVDGDRWERHHAWHVGGIELSLYETCDADGRTLHPVPDLHVGSLLGYSDDRWQEPEWIAEVVGGLRAVAALIERLHAGGAS